MSSRRSSSARAAPRHRAAGAIAAAVCLLFAATAAAATPRTPLPRTAPPPAPAKPTAPKPAPSATALYARAFADATARGSAHEYEVLDAKSFHVTQVEDASTAGGVVSETITSGTSVLHSTSKLIGTRFWLNGDQFSLETLLQMNEMTAGLDAGYWISVKTTSKYYEQLTYGLNFATSLDLITLGAPLSITGPAPYDGVSAYAISSSVALHFTAGGGPEQGHFTLYVSATPKPLPIAEVAHYTVSKVPQVVTTTFSHWGERVVLNVPKGPRPV